MYVEIEDNVILKLKKNDKKKILDEMKFPSLKGYFIFLQKK